MGRTQCILRCLSPVHVGSGRQFTKFDGVYWDKRWYVIDLDRVLAGGVEINALTRAMSGRTFAWSVWLREQGIAPSDVAAYHLSCPQDPLETPIRAAVKDVYGQPYLPGSSIKGAIRTAIIWRLVNDDACQKEFAIRYLRLCLKAPDIFRALEQRRAFDRPDEHRAVLAEIFRVGGDEAEALCRALYVIVGVNERDLTRRWDMLKRRLQALGRSREWLGQPVERALLGRDPNHDLLRALQVSDTRPVALERLAIGLVWTYTQRGTQLVEKREEDGEYKVFVEWLLPETTLEFDLRTDDFLFTDAAERELHFRGAKEEALRQLARTCNDYARSIITAEQAFFRERGLQPIADFYAELETMLKDVAEGAFLLNLGWGGGWEIKTVGDLLRRMLSPEEFTALRQKYRLGENPRTHRMDLEGIFPHTRRIGYEGGAPMYPLGWVCVQPKGGHI
ncbi:MAG: type III-A CRISPR-associated RAMP protein Csm5 [Blastocatellia bacterium]|nr:type III-A CRISPR-associated RAMP protein Csm5 [Blastocatellia bacterium]MCS7158670.1 type III-A CRISPR-associated RAMP protein Csm5 [Blastocatellia bacterium]